MAKFVVRAKRYVGEYDWELLFIGLAVVFVLALSQHYRREPEVGGDTAGYVWAAATMNVSDCLKSAQYDTSGTFSTYLRKLDATGVNFLKNSSYILQEDFKRTYLY